MRHPIGQTRNKIPVYVDLVRSPAGKHISQQPRLVGLVQEAISKLSVRGRELCVDQDMGRPIGYSFIVKTGEKDLVVYAQYLHETTYARFVRNGTPRPTRYLSIELRRDDSGEYELWDTWIGRVHPALPGSAQETDESKPYWANHAYILGTDDRRLQLNTLTKLCPYN